MDKDPLSLISSIPSLMSLFGGGTTAPYQKQQQQLAARQNQISQALTEGPNNPLYQQMYGQYQQQNRNNLASTLAEAQGQNRMNSAMGRTPLFSNERGGETLFRALTQGMQNSGVQADQQTRQALAQAGGQTLGGLQGYNSINNSTALRNQGTNLGFQQIYDILRGKNNENQPPKTMGTVLPNGYNSNANPNTNFLGQQQGSVGSSGAGVYNLSNVGGAMSQGLWPTQYNAGW